MQSTRLAVFTLWTNQRAARTALRTGDVSIAAECVHTIRQIEQTTDLDSLRRACKSARLSIGAVVTNPTAPQPELIA